MMPNPADADLADPLFEAIWQVVKSWDVNVPEHYSGYCGANGSHVMLILNAIRPDLTSRVAALERELAEARAALKLDRIKRGVDAFDQLPADVVKMCAHRGWSMHWTHRGAYLHLESSELIEALRGKRGDPMKEAADVLLVLMSITEHAGISWESVLSQVRTRCDELMTGPRYATEEYSAIDSALALRATEQQQQGKP